MEEGAQLPTVLVFFFLGGGFLRYPFALSGVQLPTALVLSCEGAFFSPPRFFFLVALFWDAFLLNLVPLRHIE